MKQVAVIGLKRIGDAVYTLPLIQAISEQYDAEVTIFSEPQVKDLYQANPFIKETVVYAKKEFWGMVRKALNDKSYDACIVLHNAFKYALLPFLADIPIRIGYQKEMRGFLLTHKIPFPDSVIHRLEHNARLGDLLGVNARGILPKVYLAQEDQANVKKILGEFHLKAHEYVSLIVGSIAQTRRWFPENFAKVIQVLYEKHGLKSVILGGPEDYGIAQNVLACLEQKGFVINLAGKTSLRETMQMFQQSKIVISNDTGPMHVASAIGAPVVTWFGAANEDEIAPPSPDTQILNAHVFCSPCVKEVCPQKTLECLHKITPEWVLTAVEAKIGT